MADENGTASTENGNSAAQSDAAKSAAATQSSGANDGAKGSAQSEAKGSLVELVGDDADTRDWLTKQAERAKDVPSLAKLAREQDKMIGEQAKKLGDSIRIPGKDATPDDVKAYRERIGAPLTEEGYEFAAPKNLPEGLPYDGDKAKSFAKLANEITLTKAQAQAVHDWAAENAVGDFNMMQEQRNAQAVENAKAETAKLVKLYGPMSSDTFKAEMAFADKALMEVGGQEALDAFQKAGLIGVEQGQKIIQSAAIASMLAKFGKAVYKEDEVLRGDHSKLNNPFADGDSFNLTAAMSMIKQNREVALAHIAAAGKKPADFGL